MTYKAATGFFVGAVVTAFAAAWGLGNEVRSQGEQAQRQFSEISKDLSVVQRDVAVIKVEVAALSKTAVNETKDMNQAQYLFVRLPTSEAELKDQRIRDMLIQSGHLKE